MSFSTCNYPSIHSYCASCAVLSSSCAVLCPGCAAHLRLENLIRQLYQSDADMAHADTARRLKRVLETYTDITRYPVPRRPDAAVMVAATEDGWVPACVRLRHGV